MSKKLIAVSAAFALALTGLVGIAPANATTPTASFTAVTGGGATTGTEAAPAVQEVPDTNTLAKSATLVITNLVTGDVVRVNGTGAVKIVTAQTAGSADLNVTTLGTQAYSSTRTASGSLTLYVYTTSTATGTVAWSASRDGLTSSGTLYIKGKVGQPHFMTNVTTPAALADTKKSVVSFNLTDVFGNNIDTGTMTAAIAGASANVDAVWDATDKKFEGEITSNKDTAFVLTLDGNGTGTAAPSVAGFAKHSLDAVYVVNNAGVSAQVAALTAQVAALVADYNKLVKKWNKRVASKTAPKKKAALK